MPDQFRIEQRAKELMRAGDSHDEAMRKAEKEAKERDFEELRRASQRHHEAAIQPEDPSGAAGSLYQGSGVVPMKPKGLSNRGTTPPANDKRVENDGPDF